MSIEACVGILNSLLQYNLLDTSQHQDLVEWCQTTNSDPSALGKEILRRQWLTVYQMREFQKGRARELHLGPYFVLDVLGEGGMGRVFKARHNRLGRVVALKVIRKEKLSNPIAVSRFKQEMHAAGQLSHPNVVVAYDAEEADGGLFLSMEYVEGTDLTKWVRANGMMAIPQACDAIRQASLGLQHAFERGMVHRDIKPSNMLLTPRGQVKLLDMGLAMLSQADLPGGENANRVTQEGYVLGTPDFLAPEQAQNPTGVDIRADIYSLGATLFYLLTARVPFEASTPTEKLLKHVTEPPPSVMTLRPEVPAALDGLIRQLMSKKPEDRLQTPMQVSSALQPFCLSMQSTFPTPQPMPIPGMRYPHAMPVAAPMSYPQAQQLPYMPAPLVEESTGPNPFAGMRVDDEDLEVEEKPRKKKKGDGEAEEPKSRKKRSEDEIRARKPKERSNLTLYLVGGGGVALLAIGILAVICAFSGNSLRSLLPEKALEDEFTNDAGILMKKINPGDFTMGSPDNEEGRDANEGPQTQVKITYSFYMAYSEVTGDQWQKLINRTSKGGEYPEGEVTYDNAVEYCNRLNKMKNEKDRRYNWAYRLPTEAEWEYCARAGHQSRFAFGDKIMMREQAVFRVDDSIAYGEYPMINFNKMNIQSHPVDPKNPIHKEYTRVKNDFGLIDFHGNLWEWCQDFYSDSLPGGSVTDPTGPASATANWHVIRGGAYNEDASKCRSASREGRAPSTKDKAIGFRVVFAPTGKK